MTKSESILWSVALPGFPQLISGKPIKGLIFVSLEFLINLQSHFNAAIQFSFQGKIREAVETTNFEWLMFYPCLYFLAMWDAYKDAEGERPPHAYLPFAFSAYFVTLGVIYSTIFRVGHILIGPVWLPLLCLPFGLLTGLLLSRIAKRRGTLG